MPDQKMCRCCGAFMRIGDESLCEACEQFLDETPEPCPMGCGRTTDDAYGGPCERCWDLAEPGHG